MSEFETFWERRFGGTPPLGYRLRESYRDRWLRIHSLGDAKRHAESPTEREEVLARANRAGTAVLGEGSRCWLVVPEYELEADNRVPELPDAPLAPAMTFDDPDDDGAVTFWAAEVVWHEGAFDDVLNAIADDRRWALWVRMDTSEVFAPYDGGADLILSSGERKSALSEELGSWISRRPDGL